MNCIFTSVLHISVITFHLTCPMFHSVFSRFILYSKHTCFILCTDELFMKCYGFMYIQHVHFLYCDCISSQHYRCLATFRKLPFSFRPMEDLHFIMTLVPDHMTSVIVPDDIFYTMCCSILTSSWIVLLSYEKGWICYWTLKGQTPFYSF